MARRAAGTVVLDRARRSLYQPGGALLDLSSVAKGHAVDRLGLCLERHGLRHYLVEAGGELRGAGMQAATASPGGSKSKACPMRMTPRRGPWSRCTACRSPPRATTAAIFRRPAAASRTRSIRAPGWPIANGVASVTVLAPSCMEADALSTALTVLGPRAGLAFAERRQLAARYLTRAGGALVESTSPAWQALLQ
jgi:thiamine biosynthesis lipoprotein